MNINAISFKGNYRNTNNKTYRNTSRRNNDTRYRDEFQHSNIISPRYPNTKNKSGKKLLAIPFATATLGTTVALMLTFSNPSPAEPPKNIQFNPNETSITEIAEENNCDLDFLLDYNNIGPNTDLSSISEVLVPSSFDYLQTEIERIEELLKDEKLKEAKREELEATLSAIQSKKNEQDNVAQVYTDGEFVYLSINIEENDENEKYKYGINVETLKKLFDIKDGAIRENNALEVRWESYENGEGSYKDYTYNWFHNGDIIKVPVSAIQTKDINLSNYLED